MLTNVSLQTINEALRSLNELESEADEIIPDFDENDAKIEKEEKREGGPKREAVLCPVLPCPGCAFLFSDVRVVTF